MMISALCSLGGQTMTTLTISSPLIPRLLQNNSLFRLLLSLLLPQVQHLPISYNPNL
jgi:hypothetical protein